MGGDGTGSGGWVSSSVVAHGYGLDGAIMCEQQLSKIDS